MRGSKWRDSLPEGLRYNKGQIVHFAFISFVLRRSRKELLYHTAYALRACGKDLYNTLPVPKQCGKVEGKKAQMRPPICGKCSATRYKVTRATRYDVIQAGATRYEATRALVYMHLASGMNEQCDVKNVTCIW